MILLAERAHALDVALHEQPSLPAPHVVELRPEGPIGIRLHFLHLHKVAEWAERFGTNVQFTERRLFVRASTVFIAGGEPMMAWTQLSPVDAMHLLHDWGYKLGPDPVDVPAAHVFSMTRPGQDVTV